MSPLIFEIIRMRLKWIVLFPVLFAAIAAVISPQVRPQWEASTLLKIGKVSRVPQGASLLESAYRVVERLKSNPVRDNAFDRASKDGHFDRQLFRTSLRSKVTQDPELVEIKVRGYAAQEAKSLAEAIVAELVELHDADFRRLVGDQRALLSSVRNELEQVLRLRQAITAKLQKLDPCRSAQEFAQCVALSDQLARQNEIVMKLRRSGDDFEDSLSPSKSYPSSGLGAVSVSLEPVTPSSSTIVSGAALIGLLLGVFLALVLPLRVAPRIDNLSRPTH